MSTYDILLDAALTGLIALVFVELRRVRKALNESNGLYKVMLDHVIGELSESEPDGELPGTVRVPDDVGVRL